LRRYSQRIFVEIDNMTRSPKLFGSFAFAQLPQRQPLLRQQLVAGRIAPILLLTLTAITRPSVAVSQVTPALAQSAPTTAPTPATAERGFPWLWLLAIPLAAGWRWSVVSRRSRETANAAPTTDDRDRSIEPLAPAQTVDATSVPEHRQTSKARLTADLDRQKVDRQEIATPVELDGNSQQIDAGAVVDPWSASSNRSEPTTLELVQELQLLEERLVVGIQRRKVGEVVVRKEIETRIVEVPIRREKLIVEQVSPEFKQLAVIDLGQSSATETVGKETAYLPTVDAKFTSIAAAVDFLKEIADREDSALQHVQMNIVLQDRTPKLND
jgi:stress response protein YsnF